METIDLTADDSGARLDRFVADHAPGLSRTQVQRLVETGHVLVNGRPGRPSQKLARHERITVELPPAAPPTLVPQAMSLPVVYEDADVVVVDKPAGLVVHPAAGHAEGTLVHGLLAQVEDLQGIGGTLRPGIVHRLDKDTSGLIVIAKHDHALASLQEQFRERTVDKQYLALVEGRLTPPTGAVEAPIGRDPRDRKRMAVVANGRPARTTYRVVEHLDHHTLVEAHPVTGRTHQIRVHFAAIGHPVVGDAVYGHPLAGLHRHFLHAARLAFRLPSTQQWVAFESSLPPELQAVLERLRRARQL
ncbi:MAG: RluA family pseudouridine synthase [Chloroflexi bacterium]|nr:RluA family pseudouridine synthase [Chloroflexota bacterium]